MKGHHALVEANQKEKIKKVIAPSTNNISSLILQIGWGHELEYHLNSTYKKICPMDLKGALTKKGACTT
jgi:hypothetical protein